MTGRLLSTILGIALCAGVAAPPLSTQPYAAAQAATPTHAYTEVNERAGAPYAVTVPNPWNGTFVLRAPGYLGPRDPGESCVGGIPEVVHAEVFELASVEFTARGFAFAVTCYSPTESGWALDGVDDILDLAAYLEDGVARRPEVEAAGSFRNIILVAESMGSSFAFQIAESPSPAPRIAGVVGVSHVGQNLLRAFDFALDGFLATDVAFGWPANWGRPGDLRDDLTQEDIDAGIMAWRSRPDVEARTEFVRRVLAWAPEVDVFGQVGEIILIAARTEHHFGGAPYQNTDHCYHLSSSDERAIDQLDPTGQTSSRALLAAMNARRNLRADAAARQVARRAFGIYHGDLVRPVITFKAQRDPLAPPWLDRAYAETVFRARRSARLAQVFSRGSGHHPDPEEWIHLLQAMKDWVETNERPPPDRFEGPTTDPAFVPPTAPNSC